MLAVPLNETLFHYMEHTATDKALDVLFYLHDQGQPCGLAAVSSALSLPKSSAHRMLAILTRRGLLERDARGRYRLGVGLVALGLGVLDRDPIVAAGRPVLQRVAADLGETCFLVAARAGHLVVLDKAEGTGLLRASPRVGSRIPVRATAAGKLYLAHAPQELLDAPEGEPRYTDATLEGRSLSQAIARAADAGFSENVDEWIEGLSVLAAPVFARDRLCGVLSLAVPTGRLLEMDRDATVGRMTAAASVFRARLEGTANGATTRRSP